MELNNVIHELNSFIRKDQIILDNLSDHVTPNKVNLHWYKLPDPNVQNLGDYLSPVVFKYMLDYFKIDQNITLKKTKHLLGIGSILSQGYQNATVWGSGLLCDNSKKAQLSLRIKKLDIRAVRGPLTRKALINAGQKCPEKYGDPAILMPLIYEPAKVIKRYDVSLILHHTHSLSTLTNHDIHQINVLTTNYKEFIDEILSSKLIISSSLHGIILAETYGVPAILLVNDTGNLFNVC